MTLVINKHKKTLLSLFCLLFCSYSGFSQRFLTDIDSSFFIKDTVRPVVKRYENLRVTGYMQPQFQKAQSMGAPSYAGGNFSQFSNNRFMLRRARVKFDYILPAVSRIPKALFTFQIDATERGVNVRDMFIKLFETKRNLLSLSAGLFSRPFGYEVNLSSTYREAPERGRMSQILMPTERDIGMMISFEPQNKENRLSHFKLDVGLFNGQGLSGTTDFDNKKDLISRLYIKPYYFKNLELSGGLSLLTGGWRNPTKYVFKNSSLTNGDIAFTVDSSVSNLGSFAPRNYYGADFQVKLNHKWGETEWRVEYWLGKQPGNATSINNPGVSPILNGLPAPTYIRNFDGAFLLFLQNIINQKHQLIVKYDWFDPNTNVKELQIGKPGTNFTTADIKFSTLGIGYSYQFNGQTKLVLYHDFVKNEITQLNGYTADLKDNILTCRLQFRF